ncbi:CHAT domain-containing protein [Paractinoplanes globisporus]|uniref:CHAT domain-containing protein n=1 Tax=Paractinoplanes globisporus TaxID=113565 RepID=A0ABW6WS36_9ACTN|nr:CHAT domain-containing protein [Actinoplanes globisporus]
MRAALRLAGDAEPEARGRVLVSLAWAESERGQVALGFRLLDEAEPLLSADRRAVLHAQRAVLLWRNGRNDLALAEYDRAVAGLTERDRPLDLVKALNNRSILRLEAGQVGASRDDLQRGLRIALRQDLTMMAAVIRVNIGCLDVAAGDLPAALGAFAAARPAYESITPGRLPALAMERARALIAAGLFREADREVAGAVAQMGEQGQDHYRAEALQTRAEAALLAGRPAAAAEWAAAARAGFLRRGNRRRAALAELLTLRAALALLPPPGAESSTRSAGATGSQGAAGATGSQGAAGATGSQGAAGATGSQGAAGSAGERAEVARRGRRLAGQLRRFGLLEDARVASLVAARAVAGETPWAAARLVDAAGAPGRLDRLDTRLVWRLARAEVQAAAGRSRTASRELAAGMETLHRYRGRFGSLDLQTGASAHGRDLARAGLAGAIAAGKAGEIFRWAERGRAQALRLTPVRPPDDPGVASALEELRQTRQSLRAAEVAGAPAAGLRGRAESLQRRIRESAWALRGSAGGAAVAPLSAVRGRLGGTVLVAYVCDGKTLHALVVDDKAVTLLALGPMAEAEEAVLRVRADLDTAAGRAMPARLAEAVGSATRRDAAVLQNAVLTPLLGLIGDREVLVVPTGLLMTAPWGMLPACAGRPVTVAPSATAWLAASSAQRPAGASVLVAGPDIREEVSALARIRPGSTVLTGSSATPAATLAALDGAGVAHLAAHGRHEAENPLFSALDLWGGPLLGYDLPRLRRPPGLVVLASCELGLTEVRPGDESLGMASALLAAGTTTVVASVGRVADEPAADVMIGFHRALVAGRSPAVALASVAAGTGFVCLGA